MKVASSPRRAHRLVLAAAAGAVTLGVGPAARAVDIEDVGGETLSIDISNTSELGYHFDNRNDTPVGGATQTLIPSQRVDDRYGEWLNRLNVRLFYWRLSLGLRLDSVVYLDPLDRTQAQELIVEELGRPDLELENRFGRELHSRFSPVVYPAKLWLGYSQPGLDATLGDFYAQLGRGLVFSVRKIDELGVDTTVRGGKLVLEEHRGDVKVGGTLFGGQLNPARIDTPTGRILTGSGSPLFFGFPQATDFEYYADPAATEPTVERARPSYLEDTVGGAHFGVDMPWVELGVNGLLLGRQSSSLEQLRCLRAGTETSSECLADYPAFSTQEASRAHDLIQSFSGSVRVPPIEGIVDAYLEVAGQQMRQGRTVSVGEAGQPTAREEDRSGYAVYANVNGGYGPLSATLELKHYRSFFPLGGNVDATSLGFGAPEFSTITYSQPPTAESIYVEPIGSPDVCNTGGRGRIDGHVRDGVLVYGWVGYFRSFSEIDPNNGTCDTADTLRTDTWDAAVGAELTDDGGKSHSWAWLGLRATDRAVPAIANSELAAETDVFYREAYVRYDMLQELPGPFSLSALGFHRRRYEPVALVEPWHEGENYLSFNWSPHFAFIFGYEYQTRPGFPTNYFSGTVEYRSRSNESWTDQLFDTVRLFVGQRRAALRCVGGTCRLFPSFEGARLELVSRF